MNNDIVADPTCRAEPGGIGGTFCAVHPSNKWPCPGPAAAVPHPETPPWILHNVYCKHGIEQYCSPCRIEWHRSTSPQHDALVEVMREGEHADAVRAQHDAPDDEPCDCNPGDPCRLHRDAPDFDAWYRTVGYKRGESRPQDMRLAWNAALASHPVLHDAPDFDAWKAENYSTYVDWVRNATPEQAIKDAFEAGRAARPVDRPTCWACNKPIAKAYFCAECSHPVHPAPKCDCTALTMRGERGRHHHYDCPLHGAAVTHPVPAGFDAWMKARFGDEWDEEGEFTYADMQHAFRAFLPVHHDALDNVDIMTTLRAFPECRKRETEIAAAVLGVLRSKADSK